MYKNIKEETIEDKEKISDLIILKSMELLFSNKIVKE